MLIIEVELADGTEKEIELDVSSVDIDSLDEKEMDGELRILIKEQYPELGSVTTIYC